MGKESWKKAAVTNTTIQKYLHITFTHMNMYTLTTCMHACPYISNNLFTFTIQISWLPVRYLVHLKLYMHQINLEILIPSLLDACMNVFV